MVRRLLVALLVGVIGVAAPAVPAQAISGGGTVNPSWVGFVVKINIGGEHPRACTGALVDPQWVVTAASCFAEGAEGVVKPGAPASPTTATVGRPNLTAAAGQVLPVDRVVPHPVQDVALLRLALVATSGPPISVSATAPTTGELLAVSGYGRTDDTWVPDEMEAATVAVGNVSGSTFGVLGYEDPTNPADEPPVAACRGDAGGPITRPGASGGQPEVVGLLIGAAQDGCLEQSTGVGTGATAVRLDGLRAWIETNTPGYRSGFHATYVSVASPTTPGKQGGIGGFDFHLAQDQVVAFDFDHSGRQDHLLMYRPGSNIVIISKLDFKNPQDPADDRYVTVFVSKTGIGGYALTSTADRIVPFDYDHDGQLDELAVYRPGAQQLTVITHGQGSSFGTAYSTPWSILSADAQLLAYDFDRDGKIDDLMAYRPASNQVSVITKGTGAAFADRLPITSGGLPGYTLTAADRVVAFDYDHTGKADDLFVYRPGASLLTVFTRGSGNTFTKTYSTSWWMLGSANAHAIAYDYDHDGRTDDILAYRSGETGHHSIISKGPELAFEDKVSITAGGIGGYDLRVTSDRIVAFDSEHIGSRTNLLTHRPGSGIAWVMDRLDPSLPSTTPVQRPRGEQSLVEEFAYPERFIRSGPVPNFPDVDDDPNNPDWGAARAPELKFELVSGDGHIVWVSCATAPADGVGVLKVFPGLLDGAAKVGEDHLGVTAVCFKVLGDQGHLKLRIPNVFEIQGDSRAAGAGHDVNATVTNLETGAERTKLVEANESEQFGYVDANCDTSNPDFPDNCQEALLELRVAG